jgi:hypothetical protein
MSYIYHGTSDLIALPGRTVQTYPSGLVRVEQSFVCRKANAGNMRSQIKVGDEMPLDEGSPAIDGLYIFPNPQEVSRPDGFVEFRVTAYGRFNKTGQAVQGFPKTRFFTFYASRSTYNIAYDPSDPSSPKTIEERLQQRYFYDQFDANYRFCIPANEEIPVPSDIRGIGGAFVLESNLDLLTQSFSADKIFSLSSSFVPSPSLKISPRFGTHPYAFQRTNFGKFDEVFVSYSIDVQDIDFGNFSNLSSVPAGNQTIKQVTATRDGANIDFYRALFSTGIRVRIGFETISVAYGASAQGNTFGVRFSGRNRILITGLENQSFSYTAQISAFNPNGDSGSASVNFKTLK